MDHDSDRRTDTRLVEDVALLLFQPDSGTIAGEGTLFYVLGGAVLAELAQTGRVTVERGSPVRAIGDVAPDDELLEPAWSYVATKPRDVQTVLAAIGPTLRSPVLDRLVERGDLRRESRKVLGLIPTTALIAGPGRRRDDLVRDVRTVLVDGHDADDRTASLIALVSASGALPVLHREIPWTSDVIARAQRFERGDQGAEAAAAAVTRTMTAIIVNAMVAATVLPRS